MKAFTLPQRDEGDVLSFLTREYLVACNKEARALDSGRTRNANFWQDRAVERMEALDAALLARGLDRETWYASLIHLLCKWSPSDEGSK